MMILIHFKKDINTLSNLSFCAFDKSDTTVTSQLFPWYLHVEQLVPIERTRWILLETGAIRRNCNCQQGNCFLCRNYVCFHCVSAPLPPRFFSKSCSFQAILREKPYFEHILGSGHLPGPKLLGYPWTKFWICRCWLNQNERLLLSILLPLLFLDWQKYFWQQSENNIPDPRIKQSNKQRIGSSISVLSPNKTVFRLWSMPRTFKYICIPIFWP